MKVSLIRASELTPELTQTWTALQESNPTLDSPYFCPEFTQAVARVRNDAEVAIMEEGNQIIGFFPFQRGRFNLGKPIGGKLSDFEGVITAPETIWNPQRLISRCRLNSWKFDHLLAEQASFASAMYTTEDSPYLDFTHGFEAYCEEKNSSGSKVIKDSQRKARKMEREVGPLRFELHTTAETVMQRLLEWKAEQHRLTNVLDICQIPWVLELLRTVRDTQTENFQGCFSVLFAGDHPVAVHLGMRSSRVLHLWFPTYDRNFDKYSPGVILLLELSEAMAARGVKRFDLGKGPESYKYRVMSGVRQVATGACDRHAVTRMARKTWRGTRSRLGNSRFSKYTSGLNETLHKLRQRLAFE